MEATESSRRPPEAMLLARQALSYGVIGMMSVALDATVFWLLATRVGVPAQLANASGIACGIVLSFGLNRTFTFSATDHTTRRFATFLAVGLGGMALSAIILALGVRLALPLMLVKFVSIGVVAGIQFVLNRALTFGRR